jgi:multiple sugar transport system substrate-binding protein
MKKSAIVLLLIAAMVMPLFAQGAKEAAPAAQSAATTTITWWAFPTFGQAVPGEYEKSVIAKFEAANPGIKVKLETIDFQSGPDKITAAIEGGTAPDVLFDAPGRIIEYGRNGKLVSLDSLFTADYRKDVNNDELLNACSDGKTYWMYPISASPFYMGINKEMWEKAGALQYVNLQGDRSWTTDNYVKALKALHDAGFVGGSVYCGGQGGDQGTRALVTNLYDARIANSDFTKYTIDSPEGIKGLKLLKDLVDKKYLDAGTDIVASGELQLFSQQQIASTICWGTSNAKNYASKDFTALSVPFPSADGKPVLEYLVNGFCVFDNKDAARADAAKKLITFICDDKSVGPESVVKTGAFPLRSSFGDLYAGNDEYKLLASWTKYYGPYYNTMKGFSTMRTAWWNMLQQIFLGTSSVEQAAGDYVTKANAAVK